MELLMDEIARALDSGLYYLALMGALTLPDMCAALMSPNGETSSAQYKDWWKNHLGRQYQEITEVDIWKLRCAVLHQARCSHHEMQYSRVIFSLPNENRIIADRNVLVVPGPVKMLELDAVRFCREMIASVREWYLKNQNNSTVAINMPQLVQTRKGTLPGILAQLTVIC